MSAFTISFDLKSAKGLTALNSFLASRSYVVGFTPSQADVALFDALGKAPDAKKYPHIARFHSHIASFSQADRNSFPASIEGVGIGGSAPAAPKKPAAKAPAKAAAADDDDDDDDLFGSDDDDDAVARAKAKADANQKANEAKKKKKKIERTQVVLEVKPLEAGQDMQRLDQSIRQISMDGLKWGEEFRVIDVAFGIQKLVVQAVIEDEKVAVDDLIDPIEALEDQVSSVELGTMNRL